MMREKLLDLMKNEGLKPSQLAELLEINPAGISHILAGRNKPGFDLLQKILRRFPRINPDWLLLDSDKMYRDDTPTPSAGRQAETSTARAAQPEAGNDLFATTATGRAQEIVKPMQGNLPGRQEEIMTHVPSALSGNKHVKRIVVLYDDQTFESYTPDKALK